MECYDPDRARRYGPGATPEDIAEREKDREAIRQAIRQVLVHIGENPDRDGLLRTPDRIARMYEELTAGYLTDPVEMINNAMFEVNYSEMVIVKDIDFYSLCEHHLLPFYGRAHVAYIPNGLVVGLSKIPRMVDIFSRRLQIQENMTQQIADCLNTHLHPFGVAVVVEGMHMCVMMRGVKKANAVMVTSSLIGTFKNDPKTRTEFMQLIGRHSFADG